MSNLQIITGDITKIPADAIVNAANTQLSGGGGVDGAIHQAAGNQELQAACQKLHGCPTGEAKVTPAFNLPAHIIIHTVGPIWHGGGYHEAQLLQACYRHSLMQATTHHCQTVLFPSISTGVYRYPLAQAALLAVKTILQFPAALAVTMVCFDSSTLQAYQEAFQQITSSGGAAAK
ncbi:Macro domain protein [Bombilactobacillus mellifer]|uniref:Macro domain protein n=1 Tax=Bombilactobacillus mellifer TaxID=1218492 RepID=A0A0F4LXT3_9LACO|nr:macro domain-containing protein [Bombilactobacillus mellifer]KJY63163.1 Macro domain protein [Bombilactobacillus mellifer]